MPAKDYKPTEEGRLSPIDLHHLVDGISAEKRLRFIPANYWTFNATQEAIIYDHPGLLGQPREEAVGLVYRNVGYAVHSNAQRNPWEYVDKAIRNVNRRVGKDLIAPRSVIALIRAVEEERVETRQRAEYDELVNNALPLRHQGYRRRYFQCDIEKIAEIQPIGVMQDDLGIPDYWLRVAIALKAVASGGSHTSDLPEDMPWDESLCSAIVDLKDKTTMDEMMDGMVRVLPRIVAARVEHEQPPSQQQSETEDASASEPSSGSAGAPGAPDGTPDNSPDSNSESGDQDDSGKTDSGDTGSKITEQGASGRSGDEKPDDRGAAGSSEGKSPEADRQGRGGSASDGTSDSRSADDKAGPSADGNASDGSANGNGGDSPAAGSGTSPSAENDAKGSNPSPGPGGTPDSPKTASDAEQSSGGQPESNGTSGDPLTQEPRAGDRQWNDNSPTDTEPNADGLATANRQQRSAHPGKMSDETAADGSSQSGDEQQPKTTGNSKAPKPDIDADLLDRLQAETRKTSTRNEGEELDLLGGAGSSVGQTGEDAVADTLKGAGFEGGHSDDKTERYEQNRIIPAWPAVFTTASMIVGSIRKAISRHFLENESALRETGLRKGKLDVKAVISNKMSGVFKTDVFQQRRIKDERKYAVYLLTDVSGSMACPVDGTSCDQTVFGLFDGNQRWMLASRLTVALTELLLRFRGISVGIGVHDHAFMPVKEFNDPLTADRKCFVMNQIGAFGGTDADHAYRQVAEKLRLRPADKKMLIHLTDGAFGGQVGNEIRELTKIGVYVVVLTVGINAAFARKFVPHDQADEVDDATIGEVLNRHFARMIAS